MEQILKNIGVSKTFSISRNTKKDEMFDRGIDEIFFKGLEPPSTMPTKIKVDENNQKTQQKQQTQNFSDFIKNDRNFFHQRKILLQQEKLQKQFVKNLTNLSTTGLDDVDNNNIRNHKDYKDYKEYKEYKDYKEINVSKWPQCKRKNPKRILLHFFV